MSRGEPSASPRPVLRLTMLLVIAVVTGLVAMHALGSATPYRRALPCRMRRTRR
ncbi:hypothetical protein OG616_38430 [Streptomyces antibioticus]|uniref:hypothetical protein n=1 Tax=Streptomyces antibioticus TaxID=1890 RepID=UPI0022528AD0|nr:hypothetical protein [Streptomyces antibioticus]MCX5173866.1 hypothetical protein [Streptomyces antibioticus]